MSTSIGGSAFGGSGSIGHSAFPLVSSTPPTPTGFCVCTFPIYNPVPTDTAILRLIDLPWSLGGAHLSQQKQVVTVDMNTKAVTFAPVPRGARVKIDCADCDFYGEYDIPDAPTFTLT